MKRINSRQGLLLIFGVGVLVGTILTNLLSDRCFSVLSGLVTDMRKMLETFSGYQKEYFFYLLKARAFTILVLWASLFSVHCAEVFCAAAGWYGICVGAVISGAVLIGGVGGIIVVPAMLLPQYVFYWLIFDQLLVKMEQQNYGRKKHAIRWAEELNTLPVIGVLFLMGTLSEAYLNPILLRWVLTMV